MEIVLIALVAVVVLIIVGAFVVGLVLKLLWWALIGLVLGAIARAILPGKQNIGVLATAGAGVAAALLGGIIGHIVGAGNVVQFLIAAAVAVVIVAVLAGSERATA
ncbi:MAG TPA: hypothetical protein VFK17_06795 [Gaiellaceae bacterium]|jgi:uncharacterized membrane protein YeaQ/YmgE (transglycosylase-associated protein family)|nr:hypothetical protein [Gaiellaceae bacterium]